MSWHIERTGRMFVVRNELGREMFDGAFRNDIPEAMQARMLALIAEAPEMLEALGPFGIDANGQNALANFSAYFSVGDVQRAYRSIMRATET